MGFKVIAEKRKVFFGIKLPLICKEKDELLKLMLTSDDVDDNKLLEYDKFVKDIYGWLVGDNGYISKRLYDRLFVDGINSRAKLKWL